MEERKMIHKRCLEKSDGRRLILYGREHLSEPSGVESSKRRGPQQSAQLRWHVLRGEWVAYACQRQDDGWRAPSERRPLLPATEVAGQAELPTGDYDVAVFEERFPTLLEGALDPPSTIVETRPGKGVCEVVVFAQDPNASLGGLPLSHVELLIEVWTDRYLALGALPDVKYVFPFENRGLEAGAASSRPEGQIYAYPFVPPIAARELGIQRAYYALHRRGLLEDQIRAELGDGRRVLYAGEHVAAFVPVCARYPYEVWVAPVRPVPSLAELQPMERADFARALKLVLMKLDGLWNKPVPYTMVFHQAPTDGASHPEAHLHVELYPAYRMRDRLRYLAGSEIGAGVFTADTLPEQKAAELRAVPVMLD
jgi:UDPglucose--hexose-1-phosphate uridylyltransferase